MNVTTFVLDLEDDPFSEIERGVVDGKWFWQTCIDDARITSLGEDYAFSVGFCWHIFNLGGEWMVGCAKWLEYAYVLEVWCYWEDSLSEVLWRCDIA